MEKRIIKGRVNELSRLFISDLESVADGVTIAVVPVLGTEGLSGLSLTNTGSSRFISDFIINLKKKMGKICSLLLSLIGAILVFSNVSLSQTLELGTLSSFEGFTGSGAVTNSGTFTGDVGTCAGILTGFTSPGFTGTVHNNDALSALAKIDILRVYIHLNDIFVTHPSSHSPSFGSGETITPGVYSIGSAGSLAGEVTLDGGGDPDAVFIIKFLGAFTAEAGSTITLTNGTRAANVFWLAEGAVDIAENSIVKGTLFSHGGAVTLAVNSDIEGRMLTTEGAITIGTGCVAITPDCNIAISIRSSSDCMPAPALDILGSIKNFSLFTSGGAVANTGSSGVIGEIGTDLGDVSGFTSSAHVGSTYDTDAITAQAKLDLDYAYDQLMDLTNTELGHSPSFGLGETVNTGVYYTSAAGSLAGTVILDGQNNPDAIFVFKFAGAFTIAAQSKVVLTNGAIACNVFWISGAGVAVGASTVGANSIMKGTILAHGGACTSGSGGFIEGRMLSTDGAVGLSAGVIYNDPLYFADDYSNPLVLCSDQSINYNANCEVFIPDYSSIFTISDNCTSNANLIITQFPAVGSQISAVTNAYISLENEAGHIETCSFIITPVDNIIPVISDCPANQTVPADVSCQAVLGDYTGVPSIVDNCTVEITQSPAAGTIITGTTTVTLTVSDIDSNTDTCTFDVIVVDTTNPVTPVLVGLTGECSYTAPVPAPVTTDNCAGTVTGSTTDATTYNTQGTHVIAWTFDDGNGNAITVNQNVIIQDITNPAVSCPGDVTESFDTACQFTLLDYTSGASATDNCSSVANITFTQSPAAGTVITGNTVITITASDEVGNTDTCTFNVTVNDTTHPSTPTLADITGQCSATAAAPTTTDNCDGTVAGTTSDATTYTAQGTHVITWTFTDAAGNSITATQNVIISDTTNPATLTLADTTGQCSATAAAPTTTDNCDGTVTGATSDATTYTAQGTHIITWTFTDAAGNSITATQNVIISDTTDPATPALADVTGECIATVVAPTTTDNCVGTIIGSTPDALTYSTQGTHIITWTFNDGNGNVITTNQNVIVDDVTNPVTPVLADITEECTGTAVVPTTTDACAGTVTGTTTDATTYSTQGTHVIAWTFDDGNGNAITVSQNVIIQDITDTAVTCQVDLTVDLDLNCEFVLADYTQGAMASDNCTLAGNITLAQSPAAGTILIADQVVTITATDEAGNTSSCTFNITTQDTTNPTLTCPSDISVSTDTGICGAAITYVTPLGTDNCSGATTVMTAGQASGTVFQVGTTTVTHEVTDASGNAVSCSFDVTVNDTESPVAVCQDITVDLGSGSVSITQDDINGASTDNCSVTPVAFSQTYTAVGVHTKTLTVTDAVGNTSTCNATITVTDSSPPLAVCQDITIQLDASGSAVIVGSDIDGGSTDNGTIVSAIAGQTAFDCTHLGANTVPLTVTDDGGNASNCDATVTVEDSIGPVAICQDITIQLDALGNATVVAADVDSGSTDNCAIATLDVTQTNFDCTDLGANTVTLTVTDQSGNTSTCSSIVTVNDIEAPVITCPADITVNNDLGICGAIVSYSTPIGTDNCSGVATTMTSGLADGAEFPAGITTITYKVEDVSGNFAECGFTVTVIDNEKPIIVCPANQIETAEANCEFILGDYRGLLMATDNCTVTPNLVVIQFPAAGTLVTGTTAVSITVSDEVNNTSVCVFDVILEDTASPIITDCPANQSISLDANCEAVVADYTGEITVTDNCTSTTSLIITQSPATGIVFSAHNTLIPVTVTVEDEAGNATSCSFNVTLLDDTLPVMLCLEDQVLSSDANCESALPDYRGLGTYADNCSGLTDLTITQSPAAGTMVTGTTVVAIAVMDAAGNMANCTFGVAVIDDTEPSITCVTDQALSSTTACDTSLPDYTGIPTVADNCSAVEDIVITQNPIAGTIVSGTNTVTFTVEDESGNTTTCNFQVDVRDVINPQLIQCAPSETLSVDDNCEIVLGDYTAVVTPIDNCTAQADLILVQTPTPGTIFSGHGTVIPVTIEATDEAGNSITCVFEVTLEDTTAPILTCPSDQTVSANATCGFLVLDYLGLATVTDNCSAAGDITLTQSPVAGETVSGTTTVMLEAADLEGNVTTCTFEILVVDTTAPIVLDCAPDVIEQLDANCEFTLTDYTALSMVTDNCNADLTATQTPAPGTVFSGDETEIDVNINYEDASGNSIDCQFTVTLEDSIAPSVDCLENRVLYTNSGCGYVIEDFTSEGVAIDNCSATADIVITQSPAAGMVIGVENVTQIIILTATDLAGNSKTCFFTITLLDDIAPEIMCGEDITVFGGAVCQYAMEDYTFNATSSDNCDTEIEITQSPLVGTVLTGHGTTQVVTLTATDNFGNQTICEFVLTLVDNIAPEIICIEDQILDATNSCTAVLPDYISQMSASDNCIETTLVQSPEPGTMLPQGSTLVTLTVTDISGKTQSCSFNVQVVDITPPVVICPADMIVENDLGQCGAIVEYTFPPATDNCAVLSIELSGGIASGEPFPLGDTVLEVTVEDTSGNVATCTFVVKVIDTEDPILVCPENQTVEADTLCMGIVGDYESMLGITDNCSSTFLVTQSPSPGTIIEGEQLVSFTVIDGSGNSVTCGVIVEVVDTTAPLLDCQEDIVQEESVVYYSLPVVTDNCQVELILAEGLAPGDEFPHGITPVTYIATDAFGNADTCSFNVLINSAPIGINDSIIIESHLESVAYNVLDNDSDPDGDIVLLTDAWTSSSDTDVWIDEDGTIDYQVYGDYCGIDTVTYLLCDGYGTCSEAFFVVEVDCFVGVVVPEGFSPNGDGVNDLLYIEGILHFPNSKVQIFNRWGREIYQSIGYQNDWDAISKTGLDLGNGKLSEGTYFILVDLGDGSIPAKSYIYLRY